MTWTRFMDMHSGGGQKLAWHHIYIEAPQAEAEVVFQNRFHRNPHRITCSCCGEDYSVSEEGDDLAQATAFERGCRFAHFTKDGKEIPREAAWVSGKGYINGAHGKYVEEQDTTYGRAGSAGSAGHLTLERYCEEPGVLVIRASEIKPEERRGKLKVEGYCWHEPGDGK